METKVSPTNIQERSEVVAAAAEKETAEKAAAEKAVTDKAAADATAKAASDKAAADAAAKPASDKEVIVDPAKGKLAEPAKAPNDPIELRKWATKASQESAALRDEVKNLKAAIEKMSKKPVDYKELAKNPDSLKAHIEAERAEAIAEMEDKLQEATTRAVASETTAERIKREQDTTNFPEWKRVFPLIQSLASNTDGRINFNQKPSDVLDALYELALQLSPAAVVTAPVAKTAEQIAAEAAAAAVPKPKTYTEAELEAAKKEAFDKAQQALRDEQNGAGIGSAGKGGKRNSAVSKEALQTMPMADLKKLISNE